MVNLICGEKKGIFPAAPFGNATFLGASLVTLNGIRKLRKTAIWKKTENGKKAAKCTKEVGKQQKNGNI